MITKQNFCEVTLRLSIASESRTKTYGAPCIVFLIPQDYTLPYWRAFNSA